MTKIAFTAYACAILIIGVCQAQNLTELIQRCNQDVATWQEEAAKWHRQFVTYVTCSTLVTFFTVVCTICWCKRPQVTQVIRNYRGGE